MIGPVVKTRFYPELKLRTWYPEGVLDRAMVHFMANDVGASERTNDEPFHRFCDLSKVTAVHLEFIELAYLVAVRRADCNNQPPVKSAYLAVSLGAYGAAHMFAALMESTPIDVRVFRKIEDAAQWLGAPVDVLRAGQQE